MRRLFVTTFITLDGVMEDPQWSIKYWNDDIAKFKYEELFGSDAFLLGRVTYQGFAEAWPSRHDEFADRMNGLPKYVVSTSLVKAEWNNSTIIRSNVVDEVNQLKQQPGQDIMIAGSATLTNFLMQNDLIDEYRLLVYPVVQGKGKHLFQDRQVPAALKLISTKSFATGVTLLIFEPDRK